MNLRWVSFIASLFSLSVAAQTFQGRVFDRQGSPIPYASLYLPERQMGITADFNGSFQVDIPSGNYHCDVSAEGYATHSWCFSHSAEGTTQIFSLDSRDYVLPGNLPTDAKKDAGIIIGKAIGASAYYRRKIDSYSSSVYRKSRSYLMRIPMLLEISKNIRSMAKKYMGKAAYDECSYRIDFQSPNLFKVRTWAETNPIPDLMKADFNPAAVNMYDPQMFGKLSPISSDAPRYYKYVWICTLVENGRKIYKIQVIPRHNATQLVSGYLYVVDGLWCISRYDLLFYTNHFVTNIKMHGSEVQPELYLPTSILSETNVHNNNIETLESAMYSIRYNHITLSSHISYSSKTEHLSQTDTLRSKHRYELLLPKEMVKQITDSTASLRDSTYWKSVRTVPLLSEESRTYMPTSRSDVTRKKTDWSDLSSWWNLIIKGNRFASDNGRWWLQSYDIASLCPEYNFVDGFWLGAKFGIGCNLSPTKSFLISPSIYYTTARHRWVGKANLSFNYSPRRQGKLSVEGGMLTDDYNGESGESRFFCSISALIYADNYIKFYNHRYLTVSNQIEPKNGLLFTSSLTYEWRKMIENHVRHSLLGQTAEINHPHEDEDFSMPTNRLLKASFELEYTPAHYYRMNNNKKEYESTSNPTFSLRYAQAFDLRCNSLTPQYKQLSAGIFENVKVGLFNHFIWRLEGGMFFDRQDMQFPDYHHFPTVMNTSTSRPFTYGFSLQDCYTYSTNDRWMMMNMTWNTPYLLVKYLPLFRHKSFDESIHARALAAGDRHPYYEVGYSVGVEDISRLGVFYGFDHNGYRSVGISISLPI
jgi:hypothetical protein